MASLSKKDKQGIALMAGVGVLMLGAMAANYSLSGKEKPDEQNCVAPVTRKTVIVIDRSDDTPEQTIAEISARVKNYISGSAQENELISIFEVSSRSATALTPVFSSCVPRRDGNDLYEHRAAIQKLYKERFEKPLNDALHRPATTSDTSPIAEVISDLSASDAMRSPSSHLMVFSDMLQNSQNGSLYGCTSGDAAIADYRLRKSGSIERPTFNNTSVELHLVPRDGLPPAAVQCRAKFWTWFFGDNSGAGAGVEFRPLPGGASING